MCLVVVSFRYASLSSSQSKERVINYILLETFGGDQRKQNIP